MDFKFKIKTGIKPAAGNILIAEPLLPDPHFQRGVVYLCGHNNADGSYGFVLNKKIDKTLDYFIENFERNDISLFLGVQVDTYSSHFLHNKGVHLGGELVADGLYFGGDIEEAINLLNREKINATDIRFFLGYSGWSEGQLDEEIQKNSWLVSDASQLQILAADDSTLWKNAILSLDEEFHSLVNLPVDPNLN